MKKYLVLSLCLVFVGWLSLGTNSSYGDDASSAVEDKMKQERSDDLKILKTYVEVETIIVVRGDYDQVEKVLDEFKIQYKLIDRAQIKDINVDKTRAIIINCYDYKKGFQSEAKAKLREFAAAGGFILTTDWCLDAVIAKTFPGTIEFRGRATGNEVVDIYPNKKNRNDSLLKGVFDKKKELSWKLDDASMPIIVLDKKNVKVLVESIDMSKSYSSGVVAVKFNWDDIKKPWGVASGKGRSKKKKKRRRSTTTGVRKGGSIVHVLSHFSQKGLGHADLQSNRSMYQFIMNFIVDAKKGNLKKKKMK